MTGEVQGTVGWLPPSRHYAQRMPLSKEDREELEAAKRMLENPGFAAKATNLLGYPIEKALDAMPDGVSEKLGEATKVALTKAVNVALFTLADRPNKAASDALHKVGVTATGGIGGYFGMRGLFAELPFSTTIMLRSVADIARSQGESVSDQDTKAACLEVLAMGGPSESDDASESGYYAVRLALAREVAAASEFLVEKTAQGSAPKLVRVIIAVAGRFGIQVTEKAAAQFVPLVGAAGGALINLAFIDHFQSMGRGHFTVRRLERKYGEDTIKAEYRAIPD